MPIKLDSFGMKRGRDKISINKKIAVAAIFFALGGTALMAGVMSGGLLEAVMCLIPGGGDAEPLTGASLKLSYQIGQTNDGIVMSGGTFQLISGSSAVPLDVPAPQLSTATIPALAVASGVSMGVSTRAVMTISFGQAMDAASVVAAASVTVLRGKNGSTARAPAAIAVSYDTTTATLSVAPAGAWDGNTLYSLDLSTDARAAGGPHLAAAFTKQFQTRFDRSQSNTFVDANDGSTVITLAPHALPSDGYIVINTDPVHKPDHVNPSVIAEANAKMAASLGSLQTPVAIREINAYDLSGNSIEIARSAPASIAVKYEADSKGYVTSSFSPIRSSTLELWTLDEQKRLWVKVPGAFNDPAAKIVIASIPHFSVYALIGGNDTNVSAVYAFPVPWKPRSSDTAHYGNLSGGITFTSLPTQGTIRIYTLLGELVTSIDIPAGSTTVSWLGTNGRGENVASGVYLWKIESGSNHKTGKLMVVW